MLRWLRGCIGKVGVVLDRRLVDRAYRWLLLAHAGTTATVVVAMPTMAMPVLFPEIAEDLGLTLVQIGVIWGTVSFAGLFSGLVGGMLGDRFGTKRTLAVACVMLGIAGASRGLASGLGSLGVTVFLSGLVSAAIPMNLHKACASWFPGRRLGIANAVISGGMALGFMIGSLVSSTALSPGLGGWRNVLFFYGAVAILVSIPWAFSRVSSAERERLTRHSEAPKLGHALSHVVRLRNVWILGIALLGVGGGVQGLLGYLPLYLREVGWEAARADAALGGFHAISLLVVFPMAYTAGRLSSKTYLLLAAALVSAVGIGWLSLAEGGFIWCAVLIAGAVRDGYMAVFMTTVTELDGVGAAYAGTAIGLAMTLSRVGGLIAPPLGNSLAVHSPRLPFVLWSAMSLLGLAVLAVGRGHQHGVPEQL